MNSDQKDKEQAVWKSQERNRKSLADAGAIHNRGSRGGARSGTSTQHSGCDPVRVSKTPSESSSACNGPVGL